jgi:hypothetical protein
VYADFEPATLFDKPRAAARYGTSNDGLESLGVAVTRPRSVCTPPGPSTDVSTLERAATFAAESDKVAVTSCDAPAPRVIELVESETLPIAG